MGDGNSGIDAPSGELTGPGFVHLRVHSAYSLLEGALPLKKILGKAVADDQPAIAITDTNNLFVALEFSQKAIGDGVQPIIGCQLSIDMEDSTGEKRGGNGHAPDLPAIVVLASDADGYERLVDLVSRAYLGGDAGQPVHVKMSWLEESGTEGLIALTGAGGGPVDRMLRDGHVSSAELRLRALKDLFGDRLYVELQRHGNYDRGHERRMVQLAYDHDLPLVATNEAFFPARDDYDAHDALMAVAHNAIVSNDDRFRLTPDHYLKSRAEMCALFSDLPEALDNTVEIARRCCFVLDTRKPILPRFTGGSDDPEEAEREEALELRRQAIEGLDNRLASLGMAPGYEEKEYRDRLEFELSVIERMKFPGYFLIVADFIKWAKQHDIPVGPGRGSGAGSLVAYALTITDVDPLRFSLLFERFLNPERVSMPDFDIDFCQEGRDRVIDYVKHKYGLASVSQIATFGTMAAKAVIRDVGRVLDLPFNFVDGIAKLIPNELGITLSDALEKEPQLKERREQEEEVNELLELALRLEGLTRNIGMHAGGVLISPGKISDFSPVYCQQNGESLVSQYDKDDVEAVGLVKFDFLGLRTLTILAMALENSNAQRALKELPPLDFETLPINDKPTYQLLKSANTTAVFQLESRGMKDMLKQAKPDCFEDIIALVALYRPGPMDLIPDFCRRKHGQQRVEYPHPATEPILKETYGIMVYQEQVMRIAQVVAGYSLGGADLLRRAMGKKKKEEMDAQRAVFVEGAVKNGTPEKQAAELFDLMEKFASYGFNKSHAAAYALVAYHTAYLKAHYPAAFLAATMSADMNNTDSVHIFYDDCAANGVEVLAPDINQSEFRFKPISDKQVLYGLGAVKGTGWAAIEVILAAREAEGPFKDLFDFCRRLDLRKVNRRVIESLIRAGAFDKLEPNRAALLAGVSLAISAAEQSGAASGQDSLFGEMSDSVAHTLPKVNAWSEQEKLQQEKSALGFYFSGHPYEGYKRELATFVRTTLGNLKPQDQPQLLAGVVMGIRIRMTQRGKMAIVTLDDATSRIEIVVGNELLNQSQHLLKEDALVIVEGRVSNDDFSGGLRVNARKVYDLAAARSANASLLKISCNGQADAGRLREILAPYCRQGGEEDRRHCAVKIEYHNGSARVELMLGEQWRVELHDELLSNLKGWLSEDNVKILYN